MKVIAFATISLDGRITRADEQGTSYSSPENRQRFYEALGDCCVAITGRKTYDVVKDMIRNDPRGKLAVVMSRNSEQYSGEVEPGKIEFTSLPPAELLTDLKTRGKKRVGITGGAGIYTAFSKAGLIDEWQVTLEPVLLGSGIPILSTLIDQRLTLVEHRLLNDNTIFLKYIDPRPL